MLTSKYPVYTINIVFLKNSTELISTNNLHIPVSISKSQEGSNNLYIGKTLIVNVDDKILVGTYQQKISDNTEYLLIDDITILNTITFSVNQTATYNEINVVNSENDLTTFTDIKNKLLGTKNGPIYKGTPGLVTPNQLDAIEFINYDTTINNKFINELTTNSILFYYEKNINEKIDINFKLKHSLFEVEYNIKTYGNNFLIRQNKFSSSVELNNINIDVSLNKINNNTNTKTVFQVVLRLINIPQPVQTNVERINIVISPNASEKISYSSTLPTGYIIGNSQIVFSSKLFNRNMLYYDINGYVSVKDIEEIQLNGLQNLNNLWTVGYYYYDNYVVNDLILNNIPIKNVFYLQIKRLSNDITVQYLYVLDTSKNEIKLFSRFKNLNTSIISSWIEYVTSTHKHNASDIITDDTHQFVSKTQIALWNSVSASNYWKDAVAIKADLPTTTNNGDTRLVLNEDKIYRFNTVTNVWTPLNNVIINREILSDKIRIKVNEGSTNQVIELPFVSNTNPGIVPSEFYSTDYQAYFESNLNFTTQNSGTQTPSNYVMPIIKSFQIIKPNDNELIYDGIMNYIVGDGINVNVIDLSNGFTNKIRQTLYTEIDNNNMMTGTISKYSFQIYPNGYQTKIMLPSGYTKTLITNTGNTILNNEIILENNYKYIVEIILSTNIINVIKIF